MAVDDLFAHAWARQTRAVEIESRMVDIWNTYLEDRPYSASLIGQGDGVYLLRVNEDIGLPQEFAVATGEWINHLRSALDYTIWAAAAHASGRIPRPSQGQIQYPVYESKEAWQRNLYRLDGLADHHRAMLLMMQPFNSDADANYLGWVNRIARSDRHRHLSRTGGYLAELQPALIAPAGCDVTLQWGERTIYDGYADAARIAVSPWRHDMELEINPRMGIDPEIEEWSRSPFWRKIRFSERLRILHVFVAAEIAVYEYDATGASRGHEALTASYKEECDARRDPLRRPPQRQRRAVKWNSPVDPRRATERELAGEDFPEHGPGSASAADD